ncbi:MAG: hypothetical protein IJA15_08025 [Clostridia bacterium]|nr:hypothetical protein [Clostridia bacterium]
MEDKSIAIIDIGSNSVRERISLGEKVFYRNTITTQLAKDSKDGVLCEQSINRTFEGLDQLIAVAKEYGSEIYPFATAAVRNSKNKEEFCNRFFARYGIKLEVVSGEKEAKLGIMGALNGADGCLIDVGGASSELVISKGGQIIYANSAKIGAVTLTDLCARDITKATLKVNQQIAHLPSVTCSYSTVYAIGGTANVIAFIASKEEVYNRDKTNGLTILASELKEYVKDFYLRTPENIAKTFKINQLRANVIHSGALILYLFTQMVNARNIILKEDDNLEGYYLEKVKRNTHAKQKSVYGN